ncbi:M1 family metallopeptidase [Aurantibacillus circumpalustris]|uniref:M1 family metallopeptidase n=1 Tax=Aurantibacillus circumpalustris TaxID=3036359 RepID=UPI00295AD9E2|nr:M1 family metallopeptidase [Aurantibacillus circumpalustris]
MLKTYLSICLILFGIMISFSANAQGAKYTRTDTLKGTYSKARSWWNVLHYDLDVKFNYNDSSIIGSNKITYKIIESDTVMQLDLMQPMILDSIVMNSKKCEIKKEGNAHFVYLSTEQKVDKIQSVITYFHGKPKVAKMPPWEGGVIWAKDTKGNPWISIACQGMAAQVWFPNKDHMYDEPDSCTIRITAPKELITVSNGRLAMALMNADGTATYIWKVVNPINNYNIIPYIGKYTVVIDTIVGEKGVLDLSFWALEDNYAKAKKQLQQAKSMLRCFEYWFGPYPFYEDGYKLVEAPFLGMEHQSAIAYGNNFQNGYMGRDLSLSGWGLKWDFIIVHESGHEWFGNSISAKDVADNWIHESFTAYAENLYTEYLFGKKAGAEYVIGTRKAVANDKPIISDYNVNAGGSIDLYYKGANMLHGIRQVVANDSLWREMFRSMNLKFRHQTVVSSQIESYMASYLNLDLQKIFDQYLRTIQIPTLEYRIKKDKLFYRWTNCVKGFNMPLKIITAEKESWLTPTDKWQTMSYQDALFKADDNFFITTKLLE